MSIAMDVAHAPPTVFARDYDDGTVRFTFCLEGDRASVEVFGKGTLPGSEAMIGFLDEAVATVGAARPFQIYVDLSRVRGAPLRAQWLFGRWFVSHRKYIGAAAIAGAGPVERRIASAVCAMARFKTMRFFEHPVDARKWLDQGIAP